MVVLSQIFGDDPTVVLMVADLIKVFFAMAFGACLGSLTNVLVYRIPLGLDFVSPASRCPSCETLLTWRENIPVFGWLMLRGRCRFCRSKISAEYPLVEAYVALLFGVTYLFTYSDPSTPWYAWIHRFQPDWGSAGFAGTWPVFIVVLMLFASLVAMFLTDAKTFQIPMILTWVPLLLGFVGHTGFAAYLDFFGPKRHFNGLPGTRIEHVWSIATPGHHGWWWIGAAIGGAVGVVLSNLLLKFGLIRRSFADYNEWEKGAIEAAKAPPPAPETSPDGAAAAPTAGEPAQAVPAPAQTEAAPVEAAEPEVENPAHRWTMLGVLTAAIVAGVVAWGVWRGHWGLAATVGIAAILHIAILSLVGETAGSPTGGQELWIQYPHARREMFRELIFLAPIIALAFACGALAYRFAGPWEYQANVMQLVPAAVAPVWLRVLAGVAMGYLVGGGLVWLVRIGGTLAFNKEAMGLGDVHLLGAVGACLGWIDAVGAFFAAVVVGAIWGVLGSIIGGSFRRMLPFGPFLALGTLLVWFGKQGLIEWAINLIVKPELRIHLP